MKGLGGAILLLFPALALAGVSIQIDGHIASITRKHFIVSAQGNDYYLTKSKVPGGQIPKRGFRPGDAVSLKVAASSVDRIRYKRKKRLKKKLAFRVPAKVLKFKKSQKKRSRKTRRSE